MDWGFRQRPVAPSFAPQIASLGGLIDSIIDGRQRREMEAERLAAQERHWRALEEQQAASLGEQRRYHDMTIAQKYAEDEAAAQQKLREQSLKGTEEVQKVFKEQDVAGAQATAQRYGGQLAPWSPSLLEVPQVKTPAATTDDEKARMMMVMLGRMPHSELTNDDVARIADRKQEVAANESAVAENARREKDAVGRYRLTMPASPEIFLDIQAEAKARMARGEQTAGMVGPQFESLIQSLPHNERPFAIKAAQAALAKAQAGEFEKPGDVMKQFDDLFTTYLREAGMDRRTRISAAAQKAKPFERPPTEGEGLANSRLTVMLHEAQTIEKLPPLSEEGRRMLWEELALRNAAEKNPGLDYTARITGLRKQLETKLKGTDKRVYPAYLSYLDPLVRQRTGANAPPAEIANLAQPIIPAADDGPDEINSKRERRRVYLESFANQSNNPDFWLNKIGALYGTSPAFGTPESNRRPTVRPAGDDTNDDEGFLRKKKY